MFAGPKVGHGLKGDDFYEAHRSAYYTERVCILF